MAGRIYLNSRMTADLGPQTRKGYWESSRSEAQGLDVCPSRPTTKECNSRVRKDFGSRKARCYNRLKENHFRVSSAFSAWKIPSGRSATWAKPLVLANTVIKRTIS